MSRRASLNEMLWPEDENSRRDAVEWAESVAEQVLDLVWRAFDQVSENELKQKIELDTADQLERNLTQLHFRAILKQWKADTQGFTSLSPSHEIHELESREGGKAMPPSNDLGFVHETNARWTWPVEAKVLKSDGALALYIKDIEEKYLMGLAAPRVGECGMIGYLLAGVPLKALSVLQKGLGQTLLEVEGFKNRPHRTSIHDRSNAPRLRIHHMMMMCSQ